MDVKWYIEKDFFWEDQPDTLLSVLDKMRIPYHLERLRSLEADPSKVFYENECVVVYGSIGFVRHVRNVAPWNPGATWLNTTNLLCSTYYAHFGEYLLNQECCFLPLAEFKRKKDLYFEKFGKDGKLFVRPDSPFKEFTGFVVKKEDFDRRILTMSYGDLDPTLMILIAKPKNILGEYRFYLSKDEVITGSRYKLNEEHDEAVGYSGNALRLAQEISKASWRPSPIFVADIGETDEGECKLLEINSFNCSGMYLCDLEKIVNKTNEIALAEWKEINE